MQIKTPPAIRAGRELALCLGLPLLMFVLIAGVVRGLEPPLINSPRLLRSAYPEAIQAMRYTAQGWTLRLADGRDTVFSDGQRRTFYDRMAQMDLASLFYHEYPFGRVNLPMRWPHDPGRLRHYPLLAAAYGASPEAVRANLESVDFLGLTLKFNRRNGAAEALRRVTAEIRANPELLAFMEPIVKTRIHGLPVIGTWNWRVTEGTDRLSAHAYGIAIDIVIPKAEKPMYWLWARSVATDPQAEPEAQELPQQLVGIFEAHGFIWGGKWYHFDTMHFEYRPEFLAREQLRRLTWRPPEKSPLSGWNRKSAWGKRSAG